MDLPSLARRIRPLRQQTPIGCLSAMGAVLLTVLTVFLGYGLGKGVLSRVKSLVRRSTSLSAFTHLRVCRHPEPPWSPIRSHRTLSTIMIVLVIGLQ